MVDKTKAFPNESPYDQRNGMDLRDYFAAQAMQGYITGNYDLYREEIAKRAYAMADAMMEARNV